MNEVTRIATAIRGQVPDKAIQWIIGQSAHETGFKGKPWNSPVYLNLNNGFGMIHPRKRPTLSTGPGSRTQPGIEGGNPYATYNNLEDSAKDLVLWLNYNKINWATINTADQYVAWIKKKGYFGATEKSYLQGVLSWIKQLKIPVTPKSAAIGGAVVVIAVLAYYYFR